MKYNEHQTYHAGDRVYYNGKEYEATQTIPVNKELPHLYVPDYPDSQYWEPLVDEEASGTPFVPQFSDPTPEPDQDPAPFADPTPDPDPTPDFGGGGGDSGGGGASSDY